jgi:hypothetical protein
MKRGVRITISRLEPIGKFTGKYLGKQSTEGPILRADLKELDTPISKVKRLVHISYSFCSAEIAYAYVLPLL